MVSDSDSKAFNKLLEVQPYGPDVVILKEDCINHVRRQLGTTLRNLVADCSKKGITLGPWTWSTYSRDHKETTDLLYRTRAIRSGRSAEEMRRGILAGLYHGYSTDDYPQHQFCPSGPD
ncbi:hypothetical protein PoB_003032600 [Plakobranchus ocellatus]|uniref:Mutator-like transposase domain-containing protein n=1 Tax=Plakobranchus ocellatus TaxID=259542 RepID=A0AAV3ZXZ0_9GAST|nr:hypothetical protein PoB_003032600 [Plakobranchus ocellatus]